MGKVHTGVEVVVGGIPIKDVETVVAETEHRDREQ